MRSRRPLAYFSHSRLPSLEANTVHVLKMVAAFGSAGNDVLLYGRPGDSQPERDEIVERFGLSSSRFRIHFIDYEGARLKRFKYGISAARNAKRCGVQRAIGRCEYSCLFAALLGLEIIYETHEIKNARLANRVVMRALLRQRKLKRVVAITHQLAEDFSRIYGFPRDRISVLPDGADEVKVRPVPRKLAGFSVGYCGHLYPGKGMEIVIPLARSFPDLTFHVVGGTEEWIARRKEEARDLPNVIFHGYVPPSMVGEFLQAFDVVLCPNQRTVKSAGGRDIGKWTSPLKLFEYMAHGKAIICSDLPVLREVIVNEDNGLLCDPDDVNAWCAALRRLHQDAALRQRLGIRANDQFEAKFTWNCRAGVMLHMFGSTSAEFISA